MSHGKKNKITLSAAEIGIIIVVIVMVVGTVMSVRNMWHKAQLTQVIRDVSIIQGALYSFELKYEYLAGDFPKAYQYWADKCHSNADICNGNGDGAIEEGDEEKMVWRHLYLAKLLPKNYSGAGDFEIGINVPSSPFDGAGYNYIKDLADKPYVFLATINSNGYLIDSSLSPKDAMYIDMQMDDGLPQFGKVRSSGGYDENRAEKKNPNCYTGKGAQAKYNVEYDGAAACRLEFLIDGKLL